MMYNKIAITIMVLSLLYNIYNCNDINIYYFLIVRSFYSRKAGEKVFVKHNFFALSCPVGRLKSKLSKY